jgi:hypothetical protein
MSRLLLIAAVMLGCSALQAAPIYKWVDADGATHYEDRLPPQGEVETIRAPETWRGNPPDAAEKQAQTPQSQRRAAECAKQRDRLAQAEAASRLYELDDEGRRRYLSADEKAHHIDKVRESIAYWCS